MLQTKENHVHVEGILSEVDLKPTSFVKDGQTKNAVGGQIKVRVYQRLAKTDTYDTILEIPIQMFASQYTNAGAPNPAYENIMKVMNDFVSIAASDEEHADRVRITNGSIRMNEYYSQTGSFVTFPRIHASFINKIPKETCKPEATFSITFAVGDLGYETDKDGVETDRYAVTGIVPLYGGKVDVIKFYAANKNVAEALSQYWTTGDTVSAVGKLNFSSSVETVMKEVDFGEPIESTRTITVSDLLITGGSSTPFEGDAAFDGDDIAEALKERKARIAALKDKKPAQKKAPAQNSTNKFKDLGF